MIGYKYFIHKNIVWKYIYGGALPVSPLPAGFTLSFEEANAIRKKMGLRFLRWEEVFDSFGVEGDWWHIIKCEPDSLDTLAPKTRYMIRKAINKFEARPVDVSVIIKQGYDVYVESYSRYDTYEKMYNYNEFLTAIQDLPENTEWWGVLEKGTGRLVGFSENFVHDKKCFFVSMWHRPESMKMFSGYLLFYEMERHYLSNEKFEYISDGARSINHETNIHDFLISKFKYKRAYAKLRIVYNPYVYIGVKVLFPFRRILSMFSGRLFSMISIALNQEFIRKRCL